MAILFRHKTAVELLELDVAKHKHVQKTKAQSFKNQSAKFQIKISDNHQKMNTRIYTVYQFKLQSI